MHRWIGASGAVCVVRLIDSLKVWGFFLNHLSIVLGNFPDSTVFIHHNNDATFDQPIDLKPQTVEKNAVLCRLPGRLVCQRWDVLRQARSESAQPEAPFSFKPGDCLFRFLC